MRWKSRWWRAICRVAYQYAVYSAAPGDLVIDHSVVVGRERRVDGNAQKESSVGQYKLQLGR